MKDLEVWSKKLDELAANWLVFLLVNAIRKHQNSCIVEDVISEIRQKLN